MKAFVDRKGLRWQAELVSHGRTSGYLNPRVHRPILQFTCLDARRPRRYSGLPSGDAPLEDCSEERLRELLDEASSH